SIFHTTYLTLSYTLSLHDALPICFMGRGFRTSDRDCGTVAIRLGENRRLCRLRSKNRPNRFRKRFLPGNHGSAVQVRVMDRRGDDHRSASAKIPLQCAWDKSKLELDTTNAALNRTTSFQPRKAKENTTNSCAAGKSRTCLKFAATLTAK